MPDDELRDRVRRLLLANVKDGFSGLLGQSYCYIAPAPEPYPFQWFWDTCFHVIMLAHLGEFELAQKNLRSLFAMQEANGFVGHMIFWNQVLPKRPTDVLQARPTWQALRPHMSALIQPPCAAIALHALYEASGDQVYLGEMYARIRRYHEWLATERDIDGDGLLTIISPFESGMDWKPSYDPILGYASRKTPTRLLTSTLYWRAMRVDVSNFLRRYDLRRICNRGRFRVKDAGFNAFYALDLECMEKLAPIAGDDPQVFAELRKRVQKSMIELMYDDRDAAFYDVCEPGSRKVRIRTPTIFFPLAAADLDDEISARVVEAHLDNAAEFGTEFPLPSVAVGDASFCRTETPFIWRGPVWAVTNWLVYHGLTKHGFSEKAQRLRRSLSSAIDKSGFREYYDPFSGVGRGARDIAWSALLRDSN